MADRKNRGGELSRSATVTVRLDPKLRYLAGLVARKHRRTLSSFIEWAIEDSLGRTKLGRSEDQKEPCIADQGEDLWDVDEADRFVKLAINYPELLTHHEQIVWKLIRENGHLWRGKEDKTGVWRWQTSPNKLIPDRLRENWETFSQVARGEKHAIRLPSWPGMPAVDTSGLDDDADDIPF